MKKYLIAAVTFCFFIVGCSKVELAHDPQADQVSQTIPVPAVNTDSKINPIDPVNQCYVITNTETNNGVVEYILTYTDCKGVRQHTPLPYGESITICFNNGELETNFAYTIVFKGKC